MSEFAPQIDQEIESREIYSDPREFLDSFRESLEYKSALTQRIKEVRARNPKAPKKSIEGAFVDVETYKQLLFDYYHKNKLVYDPAIYAPETQEAIQTYWNSVMSYRETIGHNPTPAFLQAAEQNRIIKHLNAAEKMVQEGKAPDARIGRVLVHFLSVSEGLDDFDPDRDIKRLEAMRSAAKYDYH